MRLCRADNKTCASLLCENVTRSYTAGRLCFEKRAPPLKSCPAQTYHIIKTRNAGCGTREWVVVLYPRTGGEGNSCSRLQWNDDRTEIPGNENRMVVRRVAQRAWDRGENRFLVSELLLFPTGDRECCQDLIAGNDRHPASCIWAIFSCVHGEPSLWMRRFTTVRRKGKYLSFVVVSSQDLAVKSKTKTSQ